VVHQVEPDFVGRFVDQAHGHAQGGIALGQQAPATGRAQVIVQPDGDRRGVVEVLAARSEEERNLGKLVEGRHPRRRQRGPAPDHLFTPQRMLPGFPPGRRNRQPSVRHAVRAQAGLDLQGEGRKLGAPEHPGVRQR
jgi:hypothetical protein